MADIFRESSPNMTQPWGCWGVGADAEPESVHPYPSLWQQSTVHINRSPDSPIVDYESVAPVDDDELKLSGGTAKIHHRPSPLNLIPNSRDIDPGCVTSSSTVSMASLPRTPENPVCGSGRYTWYNPESPSPDELWLPDAVPAGSQEYVSPGLRGNGLLKATHIPDLSPITGSMFAWGQGVEGFTCDPRFDTYGEGYLRQVLSGTPLLATDACLDAMSEDATQYGEDPSRDNQIEIEPIVEHRVPVAECHAPGVAENGVAPRLPQMRLPSAIHRATALGFPAVQKDSVEERRSRRGRSAVKPKAKPKPKLKRVTEFVCEKCTSELGWTVSFNCKKDLRRHKATTKAHGAPILLKCSCGTGVTRKDQMRLHHHSCTGHTL